MSISSTTTSVASMANIASGGPSEGLKFGLTDYIVFTLMLGASASIGIYFGFFAKSKNTTDEYLRGGKKMKTWPIAISLIASQLSGVAIMAIPAENYSFGSNFIFLVIAMVVVAPLLIFVIVPVFYENNVSNCYEYLELRFNKYTRQLVTASFIINAFLMLPVYMFIPSLAFSQVSGLNIHLINAVVSSICIFYTMLGGIKAVVWTDVVQGAIMLFSVVMVGVLGTLRVGGVSKVFELASEGGRLNFDFRLDPRIRMTFWSAFTSGLVMWTGKIGADQSCVQRLVSLPSYFHAKKSIIITSCGFIIIMFFNCFAGIIMFARYFGCDPILAGLVSKQDKLMPFFIQDVVGHLAGMPGIFVSCVFSAALSTLSASLNSLAGVVYFDYIKPRIKHTEARANAVMKLIVIGMGVYCVLGGFVVQNFTSILQAVLTITGINTGAVVAVFVLGMLVPRVNGKVAMTSILFSVFVMVWIIVKAQMGLKAGHIKYEVLPNDLDQCEARGLDTILSTINSTVLSARTTTPSPLIPPLITGTFSSNRDFSIFEISFYWYKMLGAVLVFLWAVPMSYVWRRDNNEKQNPRLYASCVRKFLDLPEVNIERELEQLPLNGTQTKDNEASGVKINLNE